MPLTHQRPREPKRHRRGCEAYAECPIAPWRERPRQCGAQVVELEGEGVGHFVELGIDARNGIEQLQEVRGMTLRKRIEFVVSFGFLDGVGAGRRQQSKARLEGVLVRRKQGLRRQFQHKIDHVVFAKVGIADHSGGGGESESTGKDRQPRQDSLLG